MALSRTCDRCGKLIAEDEECILEFYGVGSKRLVHPACFPKYGIVKLLTGTPESWERSIERAHRLITRKPP